MSHWRLVRHVSSSGLGVLFTVFAFFAGMLLMYVAYQPLVCR